MICKFLHEARHEGHFSRLVTRCETHGIALEGPIQGDMCLIGRIEALEAALSLMVGRDWQEKLKP